MIERRNHIATYRELGEPDLDAYYRILHEGYQTDKKYPISFAPEHMHRGYASTLIGLILEEVLKQQLKVPFVTLGTATSHPWLRKMYEKLGFRAFREVQLPGKAHRTVYLRRDLD